MEVSTPRRAGAGSRWSKQEDDQMLISASTTDSNGRNVGKDVPSKSGSDGGSEGFYDAKPELQDRSSTPLSRNSRSQDDGSFSSFDTTPTGKTNDERNNQMIHRMSPTPSPSANRPMRKVRGDRQRVPGGAGAKLIGRVDDEVPVDEVVHDGDDALEVAAPTAELDELRLKAKTEFTIGNQANKRYHTPPRSAGRNQGDPPGIERANSEASLPSILNRSEVFHQSATAAVLSLLAPRTPRRELDTTLTETGSVVSCRSQEQQSPAAVLSLPRSSAFQKPKRGDDDAVSMVSVSSSAIVADNGYENFARSPVQMPLLTDNAEKKVESLPREMIDPNKRLSDLLAAIATPENGDLHRGYMVRRKNACGALQVLTAKKVHRVKICWTLGVLPALTSVLEDSGESHLAHQYPDMRTRTEFIEARKRAIASLMNLSVPQENRLAVFHSPRLVPGMVQVINQNHDEACRGCCAVLAYLSKTAENRILMVQVPDLIDAITQVIDPSSRKNESATQRIIRRSRMRSDEDNDDDDEDDDRTDGLNENLYSISVSQSAGATEFSVPEAEQVSSSETERKYDEDPNEFIHGARQNVFAMLCHLVKEKDNAYHLARHKYLTDTLVAIALLHDSPSHATAIKILAHLTRHRANSKVIVFQLQNIVPAMIRATYSITDESRRYACYAIQNLAQDKPCRQELAVIPGLLTALCVRARQASDEVERLAAIHALKNLTDEPANLIAMTNTPECFATLMQIAHASDGTVTELMQYLGCDALATLSHWFRNIATSGQRMEAAKQNLQPSKELFVPTLKIVKWEQWQ